MSTSAVIAASACKEGLKLVIKDVYEGLKKFSKEQAALWKSHKSVDSLYRKCKEVRFVKTIWQVEKAIDLTDFYCPSRVVINDQRAVINDLDDLPDTHGIIITGTVGQGKSIFFRYLTARELTKGRCIPIFYELRNLDKKTSLREEIIEELSTLGFSVDNNLLDHLLAEGLITLFLDAFDETPEERKPQLVKELERLRRKHPLVKVLISSRPNKQIDSSSHFNNYRLSHLEDKDFEEIVFKTQGNRMN